MVRFPNLMAVFQHLDRSNCRKCNEKTCMSFAAAVFKGERPLSDCPKIAPEVLRQYDSSADLTANAESEMDRRIEGMKSRIRELDLAASSERIGAAFDGTKLTLTVMGKPFHIDAAGKLSTDIHVNPWVLIPLLHYVLHCKGVPVSGRWVPYRELPGGRDGYRLFEQRCEKPLKRLADSSPAFFEDLVTVFNGRPVTHLYRSDIGVVLQPLPLVPLAICYSKPEEGMDSSLNVFFDATAEENLGIQGLYALGTGIVRMFEKLALRHAGP
jgi:Domain of unknown function (DUF3786)/Putative Fe-S cluster